MHFPKSYRDKQVLNWFSFTTQIRYRVVYLCHLLLELFSWTRWE